MESAPKTSSSEEPAPAQGIEVGTTPIERLAPFLAGASPHPWDGYLTGPENELAMAGAQAMARGDHQGITPLVVHGASGVGKSRLLAGLVAERLRREPGSAVAHLNAETFAASCMEAVEGGFGTPRWCRRRLAGAAGPASRRSTCSCSKTWRAWTRAIGAG